MPLTESYDSGFVAYFEDRLPIPPEYLVTVTPSLWPDPDFDVKEAQQRYADIQPTIIPLAEWGAPTWDSLSVPQHLSTCLMRVLVQDNSVELALPYFRPIYKKLGLFCWQLTCAAAPSSLICPPVDATPTDDMLYFSANKARHRRAQHFIEPQGIRDRFMWFRGCLIIFCLRLDDPAHMMYEVERMTKRMTKALRKRGNSNCIGIIVSNWHMVGVSVDGFDIRHSPVLDLHDGKGDLKDGALLLMHLLKPSLTGPKTPWQHALPVQVNYNSSSVLSEDVIRHIVYFVDHETYLRLPLVSRLVRAICLEHPRVGYHTLLGKDGSSNDAFKVCSTSSSSTTLATLARSGVKEDMIAERRAEPFWAYCPEFPPTYTIIPGLAGMFQHHQICAGPRRPLPKGECPKAAEWRTWRPPTGLPWEGIVSGGMFPQMRIQALNGVWRMMEAGSEVVEFDPDELLEWDEGIAAQEFTWVR